MSKTLKQKIDHILYKEDSTLNLRVPLKLRWSFFNRRRRRHCRWGRERARFAFLTDRIYKADMKRQIKEL